MKRPIASVILVALVCAVSIEAKSATMRYALIIGNNIGVDESGKEPFPPLIHAQRESTRLKRQLIDVANFDESPVRTRLLLNATRADVKKAFGDIARQRKADEKLMGEMDSIFFLYYTGHGLSGRLLLADGPMTGETLTELFNTVGADFSVGVFDACYSGSLDTLLKNKGIRPARGLSLARKLPEQVLSAKGSIWYVSSSAGQPSYEDKNMGGVFTHYFIEALKNANRDGPGITLESIWQYTQKKTVNYTMKHNREQTPEQLVSKLRSKAPMYFSFTEEKNARMVLSNELKGRMAISYVDGYMVNIGKKEPGTSREIPVYPGKIELFLFDGPHGSERTVVNIEPGETVVVHDLAEKPPQLRIGQRTENLFAKGIGMGSTTVTKIKSGASFLMGSGYSFNRSNDNLFYPQHQIELPLRIDIGNAFGAIKFVFGYQTDKDTNSDSSFIPGGAISGGRRIELNKLDLQLGASMYLGKTRQTFPEGRKNAENTSEVKPQNIESVVFHPMIDAGIILPKNSRFYLNVSVHCGPMFAPHKGNTEETTYKQKNWWYVSGGISVTVFYKWRAS